VTINPLSTRERVIVPDRPKPTKSQKAEAWNAANGVCWWCGKPVAPDGLTVEWDHDIPRGISADDSASNLRPLHPDCHDAKTHGKTGDIATVAKAKRQEKLTRARVKSARGFRGWRKFDGTIVKARP
jgi:5-methylcytosine-specific restriction endonuclease McrA